MRALAPAAAPVGSMAAPAPITAVATAKAAVAACPSSTPLTWNRGIDRAPRAISPAPRRICERINLRSSSAASGSPW
jgi:hypothetical protein